LHQSNPFEKLSPALWGVLTLLFLSLFISYIDRGALSIAAPTLEHEFAIRQSLLGFLLASFFLTYTPFLILSGWLADRFHAGYVLAIGFAVWSASTLFTGYSGGFVTLLLCRLFLGVGESVAYPSFANIVVRHFPERQRGFANAFINTGVCAGPAFGLLLGSSLMERYGWRPYFIALGAVGFLWIPLWLLRIPRSSHTNLPYYLVHERNFSFARMGKIGALAYALMALVALTSGYVSDRLIAAGRSVTLVRKSMISFAQAFGGLALAACAFAETRNAIVLLVLAAAAYGFNISNTWVIPQILAGPRASGRWTGLQNFFGNIAGIVAPVVTGFLVQHTGTFLYAFLLAGTMSILGAASWLFLLGPLQQIPFRRA
jgi:MFS transporter, ACS family, D-galactonate transporter